MTVLAAYRSVSCRMRWSFWLSVLAIAYSTAGALAASADAAERGSSMWEEPSVLLSLAGILLGVGAFVRTVQGLTEQITAERTAREKFEVRAAHEFARKDLLAVEFSAIRRELERLREDLHVVAPPQGGRE